MVTSISPLESKDSIMTIMVQINTNCKKSSTHVRENTGEMQKQGVLKVLLCRKIANS